MKSPRVGIIRVSDHALVRFLERAGGHDMEAFRSTLEGSLKRAVEAADRIGANDMCVVADGLRYIIRNNVCVTVLREEGRP